MSVFCLTIAFQSSNSSFVSLIGYVNIFYASLCDILIFHETFSVTEIVASGVILLVTLTITLAKL